MDGAGGRPPQRRRLVVTRTGSIAKTHTSQPKVLSFSFWKTPLEDILQPVGGEKRVTATELRRKPEENSDASEGDWKL